MGKEKDCLYQQFCTKNEDTVAWIQWDGRELQKTQAKNTLLHLSGKSHIAVKKILFEECSILYLRYI